MTAPKDPQNLIWADRLRPTTDDLAEQMRSQAQEEQAEYASEGASQEQGDAGEIIAPLIKDSGLDVVKWGRTEPPPREYIVEGMIPVNNTAFMNSPGGVGKRETLIPGISQCMGKFQSYNRRIR